MLQSPTCAPTRNGLCRPHCSSFHELGLSASTYPALSPPHFHPSRAKSCWSCLSDDWLRLNALFSIPLSFLVGDHRLPTWNTAPNCPVFLLKHNWGPQYLYPNSELLMCSLSRAEGSTVSWSTCCSNSEVQPNLTKAQFYLSVLNFSKPSIILKSRARNFLFHLEISRHLLSIFNEMWLCTLKF